MIGAVPHVHVRWHGDGTDGLLDAVFAFANHDALPDWKLKATSEPQSAFVNVPHASGPSTSDIAPALRRHLAAHLPDYMIPSTFVVLENFPLTPNGKVDRKAMPAPSEVEGPSAPWMVVKASNESESKLLEIWKQVLGREDIGVADDIFELGGDSILIFQITTRATRAGLTVTPAQVFRLRTVSAIAAASSAAPEKPVEAAIQPVNRDAYRRKL
jgi:hypothetical protein